jgi:DNA helicase-2/ATP-dependent DNA helicase PcrA
MTLNSQQLQAAKYDKGPLLIVAGAGTGKTTVITERIKYLIEEKNVDPYHIFAATFTQKAADEMLARLDQVMPLGYREPWLGTFHSLCDRLLREEGLEIGLNPGFTIMTTTDQWIFLKKHLFDFDLAYYRPLGNPNKFITALIKFFSRLSDEDVSLTEFQDVVNGMLDVAETEDEKVEAARLGELVKAFATYQSLKHTDSVLDFGDLITLTLKLFRDRPNILAKYLEQFKYVLIDEFQDTNYAQYQLTKLLAPPQINPNLTVVGDDNQSIYKFRGASVSNILEFINDYPRAERVVLTANYRSNQAILDSAYRLIKNNDPDTLEAKLGISKQLVATQPKRTRTHPKPMIFQFPTLDAEVSWTIREIVRLVTHEALTYQDIAILTRANSQLEPYIQALKKAGLPYQVISNRGLFDTEEIKNLIIFLKVLADPEDSQLLFQLSQTPVFKLDDGLVFKALKTSKTRSRSLWAELQTLTDKKTHFLITTINDFQKNAGVLPVSQLVFEFIESTHYLQPLIEVDSLENQLKIKNLNLFFSRLQRFEEAGDDKTLTSFLDVLELWSEAGENPPEAQIEDIDTLSLMTVHAAKGLEFSAVFVGSLIAGRFPSQNRRDPIGMPEALIKETLPTGDEHLEEERRLFYVALTRAKHFLYLTFAQDVGGARRRQMSGYLRELDLPVTQIKTTPSGLQFTPHSEPPSSRHLKGGHYLIDRVSYSQIDTFKACPLKYKYRYLLQIPASPHHSLSFGRTVHATLYAFHNLKMHGQPVTQARLLKLYKDNFIDEGYLGAEHKKQRFASGLQVMKDYYRQYRGILGQPKFLEQKFQIKLDQATLVGKIDRIDEVSPGKYAILDYKTGTAKDQKKVDQDEQLTIYALSAQKALNLPVDDLCLYFIENGGHKIMTRRSSGQLTAASEKLQKDINTMRESRFPAKPDPVKCGYCEYVNLCPFAARPKK